MISNWTCFTDTFLLDPNMPFTIGFYSLRFSDETKDMGYFLVRWHIVTCLREPAFQIKILIFPHNIFWINEKMTEISISTVVKSTTNRYRTMSVRTAALVIFYVHPLQQWQNTYWCNWTRHAATEYIPVLLSSLRKEADLLIKGSRCILTSSLVRWWPVFCGLLLSQ